MKVDPCPDCGNSLGVYGAAKCFWISCECGYESPYRESELEAIKAHNVFDTARAFMALEDWGWHACIAWLKPDGSTSRVEWAEPPEGSVPDLADDITLGILTRRCTNAWARLGYVNWSFSYFDNQEIPGGTMMSEWCVLEVWEGTEHSECFEGPEAGAVIHQAHVEALRRLKGAIPTCRS